MRITYDLKVSEIKALIELVQELCRKNGLSEALTKSLLHKMNEKHFAD